MAGGGEKGSWLDKNKKRRKVAIDKKTSKKKKTAAEDNHKATNYLKFVKIVEPFNTPAKSKDDIPASVQFSQEWGRHEGGLVGVH